jgi:hypothetical protein
VLREAQHRRSKLGPILFGSARDVKDNADDHDNYGNGGSGRPFAVSATLPTEPIFTRWALFIRHRRTVASPFTHATLLAFGA